MKTKQDLASKILMNAVEEAQELLDHSAKVAKLIMLQFPKEVPESYIDQVVKSTQTAYHGPYRKPEKSVALMLQHMLELKDQEERNK